MKDFLLKNWFFGGMVVMILLAFASPEAGRLVREYNILKFGIFLAFFITGLTLETSAIGNQLRQFKAPAAAMLSSLVLFPLLSWVLARMALSTEFVIGVCILATAPVTVASGVVMTALGRGNVPLALFICVLGNVLAIFTIPFSLNLLVGGGGEIDLPVLEMLGSLVVTVLVPTVLGQAVRPIVREKVSAHKRKFSVFQQSVVLLIIFNAVASSTDRIVQAGSAVLTVLIFTAVLHAVILAINYGMARVLGLDRPSVTAFTIQTSQKTLTVSYLVWAGYFAAQFPMALIPSIGYHLAQMIMDTVAAERFRLAADRAEGHS